MKILSQVRSFTDLSSAALVGVDTAESHHKCDAIQHKVLQAEAANLNIDIKRLWADFGHIEFLTNQGSLLFPKIEFFIKGDI